MNIHNIEIDREYRAQVGIIQPNQQPIHLFFLTKQPIHLIVTLYLKDIK
jgi:hypothetical protein